MRTLRIFLPLLVACGVALLLADPGRESAPGLPAGAPPPTGEPLLRGADLAGPGGKAPFAARLHKLDDIRLRLVEDGYVRAYLRVDRLARGPGGISLEGATGGVFDPPENDRPTLRLTLEAPRITGDASGLLQGDEGARTIALEGGVVVRDAAGRTLMRTERLDVDLKERIFSTAGPVSLEDPERGIVVGGTGLRAEMGLRRITLLERVTAATQRDGAHVEVSCAGPATLEEDEEAGTLRFTLQGGAHLSHPLAAVDCGTLRGALRRGEDGRYALAEAVLEGDVEIRPDAGAASGLERIRSPRVRLDGEDRVVCEGPLLAVRRGPLAILAPRDRRAGPVERRHLRDRTLDIEAAGGATLRLRRKPDDALELEAIRFPAGIEAKDRDGGGRFRARTLSFESEGNRIEALDVDDASTPEGSVRAAVLRAEGAADEELLVRLEGAKRVLRFGETHLGGTPRGALDLTCTGPLQLKLRGRDATFEAEGRVVARMEDRSRLESERLDLRVHDGALTRCVAEGGFLLRDEARGSEVRGDDLTFADGVARARGRPAEAVLPGGRHVAAETLVYGESRDFEAAGDVRIEGPLSTKEGAGRWRIRCARAAGTLAEQGPPTRVVAEGGIEAHGPEGQFVSGERMEYEGGDERARLRGAPAVVARGDDLRVEAPGFDLEMKGRELAAARSLGPARVDVRPGAEAAAPGDLARWQIELKGPATLTDDVLVVPAGARLEAFDAQDRPALRADAKRVEVSLQRGDKGWSARELRAGGGVTVDGLGKNPARVTAERLLYVPGTRRVEVFGAAEVAAEGWPAKVRFERVVFLVTKDGVDLRRASGVEVEGERRGGR